MCSPDSVISRMEHETLVNLFLLFRYLVSYAHLPAVPPAACVGKVKNLIKINVEVGFTNDIQLAVVVFFPDVPAVVWAFGVAVPR